MKLWHCKITKYAVLTAAGFILILLSIIPIKIAIASYQAPYPHFKRHQIQHIYLITSAFHLPRAKIIATLVLGSQGITFTPVSIPSPQPRESIVRILRDSGRSLFWIVSGRAGASFNPRFRPPFYAFRQLHSRQLHTRSDI